VYYLSYDLVKNKLVVFKIWSVIVKDSSSLVSMILTYRLGER